jgi:MFS family permease
VNRPLWLRALCQGFFLSNNVVFIAINGLVGLALASLGWMATLPVIGYVVGSALSSPLVARTQSRLGRKRSFQWGLVVAAMSAALCAWAAASQNFWLLVAATMVAGFYNANAQLYRFAAPELVAPEHKERAISLLLAGGILGGFAGPTIASVTRSLLPVPFAAAYLSLVVVALLSLAVLSAIRFPEHKAPAPGAGSGRPLMQIVRQPAFVVATLAAALGYGVMNLLMAATPIAMQRCGLPFSDAALVLEWHVLGMFVPSFFTGHLVKRFGALPVMAVGVVLNLACIGVALSGIELMQFVVALFTLGVGWNFLFIGGIMLLIGVYRPEEKIKAQGAMDFCVFTTMAVTSFASGALVTTQGWQWLNLGSLLPVGVIAVALGWLASHRRRVTRAAAATTAA